jgi:hypothetical protein
VQDLASSDAGLAGGRGNRLGVVAADNNRPHARVGKLGHRIADTGAQRIAEGDQADESELGLDVRGLAGGPGDATLGDRDDPHPVVREPSDAPEHRPPLRLGYRARIEDGLGGSLHGDPCAGRVGPYRTFSAAHRIERVAGEALARRRLTGGLDQRAIDRVLRHRRPVSGRRRTEHAFTVTVDSFNPKRVLGQRPGLVGKQHGYRADGLRRAQPPQQHALPREAQTA